MAGCINDIDLCIFIENGCVFGKNCDAALTFDIVGVHDTFGYFLICTEYTALFQKFIHQCCFTVVNMGDDCNISNVFTLCIHVLLPFFLPI